MTMPHTPDDGELLRSMLAGDEEALATLYRRRQGSIYRFALQMSGSPALAEDVTQEVFMVLMREGTSYDSARGPLNWFLFGIARNLVRQRLGREQFYASLTDDANEQSGPAELRAVSDPLAELSRSETIETVRKAVLSLPPRYRETVENYANMYWRTNNNNNDRLPQGAGGLNWPIAGNNGFGGGGQLGFGGANGSRRATVC